ncbi:MAG: hypothetical protein ACN4GF_08325 [Lentimonas sp.]
MKCLTIVLSIACALFTLGCDQFKQAYDELTFEGSSEEILVKRGYTADRCVSIGIPKGWSVLERRRTLGNDFYDLRVGNCICWVEMIVEPSGAKTSEVFYQRSVGHFSVSDYSEKCLKMFLKEYRNDRIDNGPISVTIDGISGFQYVIRGQHKGQEIVALLTHLKSDSAFYQIVAQTRASDLDRVKYQLLAVVRSFDEVADIQPKFRFKSLP